MSRRSKHALRSSVSTICEALEQRALLCDAHMLAALAPAPEWSAKIESQAHSAHEGGPESTVIDWTNRGANSDNFFQTFGTSAERMRNVVDAALFAWQRVITNWNRSDGTTTLQVTITVGAPGSGFGGAAGPGSAPADGKPRTGSVSLGGGSNTADPNDVNNWFGDTSPYDNAEFTGNIINAYSAEHGAGTGGFDFFSLVTIELAHVLGIISDANNAGGGLQGYHLENFVTDTGIPDTAQGGGNGTFRTFNGPTVRHVMTSFNSGSAGVNSWGNVVHSAGPTADFLFGGTQWRGSVDTGNALYGAQRYLPSFADAHILKDAYGYSIAEPMSFGTMYAIIDETTGRLTVRGGAGVSNDNINVSFINGSTIRVSVDVGADVPGTGSLPGAGNLPAFVTDFLAIGVTEIVIDAGDGDDTINVESVPFFAEATVRGGTGNDFIQFSPGAANLDTIPAPMNVDGGTGSDTVLLADYNSPNSSAYAINSTGFTRPSSGGWTFTSTERREVYGADGANAFNIASTAAGTTWKLAGHLGNDVFNVGLAGGNADLIKGVLEVYGEEDSDTLNYNDFTAVGNDSYTLNSTQLIRSNNATVALATLEAITINAGSGNNTIALPDLLPVFDPPAVAVNGNGGNDTFQVDLTQQRFNNTLPITIDGGAGTDLVTINTTLTGTGTFGAPTIMNNSYSCPTARTVNYSTFEGLTFNALYNENRVIFIVSTAANTPVTVNGGAMSDIFAVGGQVGFFGTVSLDQILGPVTLNGNGGSDTVNLNDINTPSVRTFTVNGTRVDRSNAASVSYFSSEAMTINAGDFADGFFVNSTLLQTPVTINANGGDDFLIANDTSSALTFRGGAGNEYIGVNSDSGPGDVPAVVLIDQTDEINKLETFVGGTLRIASGAVLADSDVDIFTGEIDMAGGALLLRNGATLTSAEVRTFLTRGYAGGSWNGTNPNGAINSSLAAASFVSDGVGYGPGSEISISSLGGFGINAADVLIRHTLNGDANLDKSVNSADFNILASNFGTLGQRWSKADFTYDAAGAVNSADFNAMASNFGAVLGGFGEQMRGGSSGDNGSLFGDGGHIGDDTD